MKNLFKKKEITKIPSVNNTEQFLTVFYCTIKEDNRVISDFISHFLKNRTQIVKNMGNAIAAYFDNADLAVKSAIELQGELINLNNSDFSLSSICLHTVNETEIELELGNISTTICISAEKYGLKIGLSGSTFIHLENPNLYNFRFIGNFSSTEQNNQYSLFDFFDGDQKETIDKKIDSKSVFEDSVFNYYNKRLAQSIAGFRNTLKLFPEDKASTLYIHKAEQEMNNI